ncbi:MAG: hypothetical protein UY48_C0003G0061 [Candidatus Gottesmanbacteria bacterium GW2011_GWB1_49_7]|uniref:Uncharacterized protein n=1 Tax=Candidatus Gottesmanbacteria bacterium GW2011_GWB1_49_7 TaxID=1618448 RepID=A0A0G1Z391_9BACT|nr:MAG: hypothetical protein UY48_C0003G0061 [Candidatus Gottesmanbacteria bacterium GW2011_GWB1_49_7]
MHKECTQKIKRGERCFYYPDSKTIYASACGHAEEASKDFSSMTFDETSGAF